MFKVVRKSEIHRLKVELHQEQTFPSGVEYETLRARAESAEKELASLKTAPLLHCSFCGKNHTEVEKLFAGPAVFICSECAELCMHILLDDRIAAREKRS